MKKLMISFGLVVLTTLTNANINTNVNAVIAEYEGRYAKDCSKKHAHKLSYVISDTYLVRLIDAKEKHANFVVLNTDLTYLKGYQAIASKSYEDFRVDFYQKDKLKWAKVRYLGQDRQETQIKDVLMQCINQDLISKS